VPGDLAGFKVPAIAWSNDITWRADAGFGRVCGRRAADLARLSRAAAGSRRSSS